MTAFLSDALRLVGHAVAALLCLMAMAPLASRRVRGALERTLLVLFTLAGTWHAFEATALLIEVAITARPAPFRIPVAAGAGVCLAGAATMLAATRSSLRWLSALAVAAQVCSWLAAGAGSATFAWTSALPPAIFYYGVRSYHLLGLTIGRRFIFTMRLGATFALYLFVVRRLAGFAEDSFEVLGPLVEVVLIFAAALVWLPLYGWISRFLAERTRIYADLSKRVLEEAAGILDARERLEFLAAGVGRSFGVRRVVVSATNDGRLTGSYGPESPSLDSHLTALEAAASRTPFEAAHVGDKKTGEVGALLEEAGFHYVFPLRYEGRLLGLLLVDCAPRQYLDEDEAVLLGLSRQIAHSIETLMLIEEKIRLERALVQQEHLASLGRVAATIAHEIRNPLSSIKTLAQLMREDGDVDARYSRDLGFIIGETDRLSGSVQQLLTFSRPAADKQETVDVAAALETALDVLARQQAQEGLRIERSIESGLRLQNTSTEAVKQIVLNLALNAVQASPAGAVVRIDARTKDGLVAIVITDQGPGISSEVRERMFEPFFTTRQKGTGLGLAIVQKNVRAMGGEIQVDSPVEAGRGTRVTVTLPASPKK